MDGFEEGTSIKALLAKMQGRKATVLQGTVIQKTPLKIQISNDEKLIITEANTYVPWHMTDYETKCDIELRDGTLDSQTYEDGEHSHTIPMGESGETPHVHHLETYNIYKAYIKVYNALKVGHKVHVLAFAEGKQYFVIDRVE